MRLPSYLERYDRLVWKQIIETQILPQIKPDACPGTPYAKAFQTNAEFMLYASPVLVKTILDRIELILAWDGKFLDNLDLVERCLVDVVRLFVKNEPHNKEKVAQQRLRLIMCVSIVDKAIEMLVHGPQNKNEIANWDHIPSKPGMGFTDRDTRRFYQRFDQAAKLRKKAAADVSGWDWSVQLWLLQADTDMRKMLYVSTPEWLCSFMDKMVTLSAYSVYQLSNGQLLVASKPGIMNSGRANTSSSNSRMRALVACLVGSDYVDTMGDDCLEDFIEDAPQRYRDLGFRLKAYDSVDSDGFEFCSHHYSNFQAYGINITKGLMKLVHHEFPFQWSKRLLMLQFEDDFSGNPDYQGVLDLLVRVGWYAKTY
jgi:hypothetical protein